MVNRRVLVNSKSRLHQFSLRRREANYTPLTPLAFLQRTAAIFPERVAVKYDDWKLRADTGVEHSTPAAIRQTWKETLDRTTRLASALAFCGINRGDVVSVLSPNTPAFIEAHYGINACGGVINPLNTRLDAKTLAYIMHHSETRILLADTALAPVTKEALDIMESKAQEIPLIIDLVDPIDTHQGSLQSSELVGGLAYETFLERAPGYESFDWLMPEDEWDAQGINYTSGTTGTPKGVVYSHRGSALTAMNNSLVWGMGQHPVFLWTLPLFHCNGWFFPHTVTLQAGTHVCLRTVDSTSMLSAMASQEVTHFCGAPVVMNMIVNASESDRGLLGKTRSPKTIKMFTAGAPPPAAVLKKMEEESFDVTHVYGLTETYGPAVSCPWQHDRWDHLPIDKRAKFKARQGFSFPNNEMKVVFTGKHETEGGFLQREVPWDGKTIGEIVMRGNVVMKGYLKDERATDAAFEGGWFHSGDLAVVHQDGYVEIKDRAKVAFVYFWHHSFYWSSIQIVSSC